MMRIRTLVLVSLTAVLVATVNGNLRATPLPVSQYQTSANAPQKTKLDLIMPETAIQSNPIKAERASRSNVRKTNSNIESNKAFAQSFMAETYGWKEDQFQCLVSLWERESGWKHTADNPNSSAYGIPQALPGKKMASSGSDWETNPHTQIKWGLEYIQGRYDTPCGAWKSFKKKGWY
jgi:hypothetical protein